MSVFWDFLCIFSNNSDRFGNIKLQPQGKHMTFLIHLHTHINANWYICCNNRIPYTLHRKKSNLVYVTHHLNCSKKKVIPTTGLLELKESLKFSYYTGNILMNVSVTNRFSANIKFDPLITPSEQDLVHKIVWTNRREWGQQQWPAGA